MGVLHVIKGLIAATILVVNTLIIFSLMMPFALLKLLLPFAPVRKLCDTVLNAVVEAWISVNAAWMQGVNATPWRITGLATLNRRGWYLVSSNHQSWVDILVLQRVLNRKVPLLKFFLKYELIYVPVMGLAWWALDFPFMRRSGDPKGFKKDLAVARQSCEKFAHVPTSVINFLEGTRFTAAKHAAQKSPYRYLLKPKTGGLAIALATLGEQFHSMLDVTIVYPGGIPSFIDLLCGRVGEVIVSVREVPIPTIYQQGDPTGDPALRRQLQDWVNELWQSKDEEIHALLNPAAQP